MLDDIMDSFVHPSEGIPDSKPVSLFKPGIYPGESDDIYFVRELDVASNSSMSKLDGSNGNPMRYYDYIVNGSTEETESLLLGKALHCHVLEPDSFCSRFVVAPEVDRRTKYGKDVYADFQAEAAGKSVLTIKQHTDIVGMAMSLRGYQFKIGEKAKVRVGDFLDQCDREVVIRWIDPDTGVQCKAKLDFWHRESNIAGDAKSAKSASAGDFARSAHTYRYHVQQAHYVDGLRVLGHMPAAFPFFVVESSAPYCPASWLLDAAAHERGMELRNRALRKLKACLDSNIWDSYTSELATLPLPAYAFYEGTD